MPFEIVTSLDHKKLVDPNEHVVIRISEGRWRNIVCSMAHWNNQPKSKRLLLVRSRWPVAVQRQAEALLELLARRGVPATIEEINAWAGGVNTVLRVGDKAPDIYLMRGFSPGNNKIRLPGRITGFKIL